VEAPSTLGIDVRFTDRVAILARTDAHQRFTTANPQGQNYVARLNLPTAVGPIAIPDGWASVDATAGGTTFRFVTTHLSGIANPIQVAQGTELLGVLGQTTLPVVLVGDFNSSATPAGLDATPTYGNLVAGGLVDAWAATQSGKTGYTCCQHVPDLLNPVSTLSERIDFVFVRGSVRPEQVERVGYEQEDRTPSGLWPSDHAGVVARLTLRQE